MASTTTKWGILQEDSQNAAEISPRVTRFVITPDDPEHLIEPETDALGTTTSGLPLPAVLYRGRLIAGGPLYRLCLLRSLPCPAIELDPALDPDEVPLQVAALDSILDPGSRALLAALRCQPGRGRPPRGATTISRAQAADLARVPVTAIGEAAKLTRDPGRIREVWCRESNGVLKNAPQKNARALRKRGRKGTESKVDSAEAPWSQADSAPVRGRVSRAALHDGSTARTAAMPPPDTLMTDLVRREADAGESPPIGRSIALDVTKLLESALRMIEQLQQVVDEVRAHLIQDRNMGLAGLHGLGKNMLH